MPRTRNNPDDFIGFVDVLLKMLTLIKEGKLPCVIARPSEMKNCHVKWDVDTGVLLCRAGTAAWLVEKGFRKEKNGMIVSPTYDTGNKQGLLFGVEFRKSIGGFAYDLIHLEESVNAILENHFVGFYYRNQWCSIKQWDELREIAKSILFELDISVY